MEAQAAFEEINQQVTVTPDEVQQYYTAHAAEFDGVTLRQIVVRKKAAAEAAKPDPAHPSATPETPGPGPDAAKARAEAIRKELLAGTDTKKIIAESAPGDVNIDTVPRRFRRGKDLRPEVDKVVFALKDGEVSEPLDYPQALLLFQVVSHDRTDLKAATPEIEGTLRQQKLEAAMDAVKKQTTVWMDDQYFEAPPQP
jgi:hypothetical protein